MPQWRLSLKGTAAHAQNGKNLIGYRLLAPGEEIGKAYDFYIDDRSWRARYLVAEVGKWPGRRRVLVARTALEKWMASPGSFTSD